MSVKLERITTDSCQERVLLLFDPDEQAARDKVRSYLTDNDISPQTRVHRDTRRHRVRGVLFRELLYRRASGQSDRSGLGSLAQTAVLDPLHAPSRRNRIFCGQIWFDIHRLM